ncbi:MAG TPA: hypothetical protein VHU23_12885 [Rhizomicrobium sp.]|nr:hypothetical protein [Rhizomicrobium sp.]
MLENFQFWQKRSVIYGIDVARILETSRAIPGSFPEESAAVWCALLPFQQKSWTRHSHARGDYMEIGVLHGKSASVLASFGKIFGNTVTIV